MKDTDLILDQNDAQTTKDPLETNGDEGRHGENLDPAARFDQPKRNRQDHRHQANPGRDQTVCVLVKDAADPSRDRKKEHVIPKTIRPIRHRHSGAV